MSAIIEVQKEKSIGHGDEVLTVRHAASCQVGWPGGQVKTETALRLDGAGWTKNKKATSTLVPISNRSI